MADPRRTPGGTQESDILIPLLRGVAGMISPKARSLGAMGVAGLRSLLPDSGTWEQEYEKYNEAADPERTVMDSDTPQPGESSSDAVVRHLRSPTSQRLMVEEGSMAGPLASHASPHTWAGQPSRSRFKTGEGGAAYDAGHYASAIENALGIDKRYRANKIEGDILGYDGALFDGIKDYSWDTKAAVHTMMDASRLPNTIALRKRNMAQTIENYLRGRAEHERAKAYVEAKLAKGDPLTMGEIDDLYGGALHNSTAAGAAAPDMPSFEYSNRRAAPLDAAETLRTIGINMDDTDLRVLDLRRALSIMENFDRSKVMLPEQGSFHIWDIADAGLLDYNKALSAQPEFYALLDRNPRLEQFIADSHGAVRLREQGRRGAAPLSPDGAVQWGVNDLIHALAGENFRGGATLRSPFERLHIPEGDYKLSKVGREMGLEDRLYPSDASERGTDALSQMGVTGHRYTGEEGSSNVTGGIDNYVVYGDDKIKSLWSGKSADDFIRSDAAKDLAPRIEQEGTARSLTREDPVGRSAHQQLLADVLRRIHYSRK